MITGIRAVLVVEVDCVYTSKEEPVGQEGIGNKEFKLKCVG